MAILFEDFLISVPAEHQGFVAALHEKLLAQGCTLVMKEAKSGYAASYQWQKKTVMNWVFRKAGILARIYGDNAGQYEGVLAALPAEMQSKMTAARDCKNLLTPGTCSPTCVKGFVYNLDGALQQKCRNDGMFFLLTNENAQHIEALITAEVAVRKGV